MARHYPVWIVTLMLPLLLQLSLMMRSSSILVDAQSCSAPVAASVDGGYCFCDQSAYCDVDCCCDPNCRPLDTRMFASCLDQYNLNTSCTCLSSGLMLYNASWQIGSQQSYAVPGSSCFFQNSYASVLNDRNYYLPPNFLCSILPPVFTLRNYSYNWTMSRLNSLIPKRYDAYKSGSRVLIVYGSSSQGPDVIGFLPLPKPSMLTTGPAAVCNDNNAASFLRDESWSCYRVILDINSACTSLDALRAASYYQNMNILTDPQNVVWALARQYSVGGAFGYQSPEIEQLQASGVSLFLIYFPYVPISATFTGSCTSSASPPVPSLSSVGGQSVCSCAVTSVSYSITLDTSSLIAPPSIASAVVNIGLGNVTTSLQQSFAISFVQSGRTSVSNTNSGSPGYLIGRPILALYTNSLYSTTSWVYTTNSLVSYASSTVSPLRILASPAGSDCSVCRLNPSSCAQSIKFGMNYQSGCIFKVDAASFSDICDFLQDQSAFMLAALPYPAGGNVSSLLNWLPSFGVYGIAQSEIDAANWVTPTVYIPSAAAPNDYRSGPYVCNNVIRSLAIEVMYTKTGSISSPMPAIVGIGYRFGPLERVVLSLTDQLQSASQVLELKTTVKFIDASSLNTAGTKGRRRHPPYAATSWFDFFYLFYVEYLSFQTEWAS